MATQIRLNTQAKDGSLIVAKVADLRVTAGAVLAVNVAAGRIRVDNVVVNVSATSLSATDNTTNYVEVDAAGLVSINAVGFTAGKLPLATVVAVSNAITTVDDARSLFPVHTQGPTGPRGATGPAGATGPQGPTGAAGSNGATGPAGATGPRGPSGAAGSNGATGPMGPTGARGPSGAAGSNGATGPMGPTGARGPTGVQGPTGARGITGPQGPTGTPGTQFVWKGPWVSPGPYAINDCVSYLGSSYVCIAPATTELPTNASYFDLIVQKGNTGATGPQGPTGARGATGPQGPTGARGPTGAQGPTGPRGVSGATGATGATGPRGATGVQGPTGPRGVSGAQGPTGPRGLTGAQGPTGPQGTVYTWKGTWVSGSYSVNDCVEYLGSGYVCILAATTQNPTNATYWSLLVEKGTPGATGPMGPTGPRGLTGAQGPTGPRGVSGAAGATGPRGATGAQGPTGPQGITGPRGLTGAIGPTGPRGLSGVAGATGPMGPTGPIGPDVNFVDHGATASGAQNGINRAFTTANTFVVGSLVVFLNGQRQTVTDDYTITGVNEFTFVVGAAPQADDTIVLQYRY